MPTAYSLVQGFSPRLDFTNRRPQAKTQNSSLRIDFTQRRPQANLSTASRSWAETRILQSSADAASATSELRLTALTRVERFPNLKSTPSNGMTTTTTIDENKSTHLLVKINVF
ncbi:hypothetical protein J6590_054235 [Homalodisca vitripennis]|nr:hypothetical protein J6590_054235 [Homalodisca vitripennis]